MREHGAIPGWLDSSETLTRAYALANEAHRGQSRKDGTSPYVGHPLAVAERLARAGLDEPTVAAALLHDVVEDSEFGLGELVEEFGVEIGELVAALTDDETIEDFAERKREHRARIVEAGPRAAAIYAADKLFNIRDLRRLYDEAGEAAAGRFKAPIDVRVALWHEDLQMLGQVIPDSEIVAELRQELRSFERMRPGAPHGAVG